MPRGPGAVKAIEDEDYEAAKHYKRRTRGAASLVRRRTENPPMMLPEQPSTFISLYSARNSVPCQIVGGALFI